jgi:hypothetical protein
MKTWKQCLPDVLAVFLFAVLAFAYFFPADTEDRILYQHDSSAGRGAGMEINQYAESHDGTTTRWTNSLFGGMPTYQMAPSYNSTKNLSFIAKIYHLFLPDYVWYVFAYLLGFYILLRAFDFRQSLAALGAIIWAFSSYFFIIIAAGHIWKVITLAYIPPTIAGLVLAYRGKYLWGGLVTALFVALQINANHVQMSYYFLPVMLFMVIAYLVKAIKEKKLANFGKATATVIVGALLGVCINISNLYHTYEYQNESMRGKSELVKANNANQTNSGLERDYITMWSYGIGETWSLLVPNIKGGASVPLIQNETAMEKADSQYTQLYQQIGQYWGEQPGTSGPVYVGAFVLMLFILGLFILKGPMKWALLAATVLSILLSWGRNLMGFTDFFIDYIPMYSKFRTVASILVVAEFTIPLLAMLTLKKICEEPDILTKKIKFVYISFGITGGMALLFAIMPSVFFSDFVSTSEIQAFQNANFGAQLQPILDNLTQMRKAILVADSWRSFWIVIVGTLFLLLYKAKKLKAQYMVGAIAILCLIDMWQVNKRYLNDEMFVEKSQRDQPQQKTATDEEILKDKSLDYRVLNLASNTFNENETSYYHKSVGGYHAAKLRRYQELIEAYISPEMQNSMKAVAGAQGDMTRVNGDSIFPVLNMLNTKYFIFPLQNNQTVPIHNPYAYGNAWFVDKIDYVTNANEEISKLGKINPRHEAVADSKFKTQLGESQAQDSSSIVKLTSYEPNDLKYDVKSGKGGIIVFSEIYYPGWTATVDGQNIELGRVNYVLRALNIKAGEHKVELKFFPKSVDTTETIAYSAYGLLILAVLLIVFFEWKKGKTKKEE